MVDVVLVPAGLASSTVSAYYRFGFFENKILFNAPFVGHIKSYCKRRWPSGPSNLLRHLFIVNKAEYGRRFWVEDRSLM